MEEKERERGEGGEKQTETERETERETARDKERDAHRDRETERRRERENVIFRKQTPVIPPPLHTHTHSPVKYDFLIYLLYISHIFCTTTDFLATKVGVLIYYF